MTKFIKQLSKDNLRFAKDWLHVNSWKYSSGWTILTLLLQDLIMSCHMENVEMFRYWELDVKNLYDQIRNFYAEGYSKECTLNMRLRIYGIVLQQSPIEDFVISLAIVFVTLVQ